MSVCAKTHTRRTKSNIHTMLTYIQIQVRKPMFFYQREEYKTALPQCVYEKLYGVTTALEKSNVDANIKCGIKKLEGLSYKAFWSPEFTKHTKH